MSAAQVHLLLNHIPILGTIGGLLLVGYGMIRKSEDVTRVSLFVFIITALVTIPVYLTGDGTAQIVGNLPGVSTAIIAQHDTAATFTIVAIEILGTVSLLSLWLSRRSPEIKSKPVFAVLVLAIIASGLGAWTGNLGGQIRHTEVRSGFAKQ